MTVIAGGRRNDVIGVGGDPVGDRSAATVGLALGAAPAPPRTRIVDAMLVCMGRWGLAKTTVEDIAREAGLSRATVYRLFPGGKNAILLAALHTEIARLVAVLTDDLDRDGRPRGGAWPGPSRLAAGFLAGQPGAGVPAGARAGVGRAVPGLRPPRHAVPGHRRPRGPRAGALPGAGPQAADVAVWAARVVMSYLSTPAEYVDLTDEAGARHLVSTYRPAGARPGRPPSTPSADPSTEHTSSRTTEEHLCPPTRS